MIRKNYKVIKVKVSAGWSHGTDMHELKVWFEGMDTTNEIGCIEHVGVHYLKEMGVVQKGYSFKKSQEFYDTEIGMSWLGCYLRERDCKKEKEEKINSFRWRLDKLSLEQLNEIDNKISEMEKSNNI